MDVCQKTKKNIYAGQGGGNGGNVYFVAHENLDFNLCNYAQKSYIAGEGKDGYKMFNKGRDGRDLYLSVPVGTYVYK